MKNILFIAILFFSTPLKSQQWRSVNDGINRQSGQSVNDMLVYQDTLFIIGQFDSLYNPGQYCSGFSGWDSSQWNCKSTATTYAQGGLCINTYQNEIYMGGLGPWLSQPNLSRIGRYDGSGFLPLGRGINNGMVRCMQEYNGSLYVGGNFTTVDSTLNARRIARWDGSQWHTIGTGMSGGFIPAVRSMIIYNGELVVGGMFGSLDGNIASNIIKYNGINWNSLGNGVSGQVKCLVVDTINNILYVGGQIWEADSIPTPTGVAAWDGTSWSAVGTAPILNPVDMVMYRGKLFAGGIQKGPNSLGQTVFQMAWFDGQNWIPACDTMYGGEIESMCVYKDELYVGGFIKMIDDSARYGIARTHFPNVSVQQISNTEAAIELYPNPTGSVLTVRIKDSKLKFQSVQLNDLNGIRLIKLDKLNESQVNLELQSIASGMYIVVVKTERGTSQYKIVKE